MKHSSDFAHILVYHLGPYILVSLVLPAFFLVLKLRRRGEKRGKKKLPKVAGLNRRQRRQQQAMKRHVRNH